MMIFRTFFIIFSTSLFISRAIGGGGDSNIAMGDCATIVQGSNNQISCHNADTVSALLNLDFKYLRYLFDKGEIWRVESAFRNKLVAKIFFANLKKARKTDFLKELLKAKLSPNILIINESGLDEALLLAAHRANNSDAMLILLSAGASPHAYQDLRLVSIEMPFFIYPHRAVQMNRSYTTSEKTRILKSMISNGLVIFDPADYHSYSDSYKSMDEEVIEIGKSIGINPLIGKGQCPKEDSKICIHTDDKESYCNFRKSAPYWIVDPDDRPSYGEFSRINVKGFLGTFDNKSIYIGVSGGYSSSNVIIEYSADRKSAVLHKFISPGAGLGHCRPGEDGYIPRECWRAVSLDSINGDSAKLENYYKYKISFCD